MEPVKFKESNCVFGPPPDMSEAQVRSIPAFQGEIKGGSCDGCAQVVVAYRLTNEDLAALCGGALLYISMIGGLAPHYPSLSFEAATHPA